MLGEVVVEVGLANEPSLEVVGRADATPFQNFVPRQPPKLAPVQLAATGRLVGARSRSNKAS